ncbi:MAG TPA: flagellar basal body rod protein FlgB [Burkholderiaceae bacterium]|nr:flagellar basal body rod protein FlgB [Burkholderiaceae bacterium]
MLEKLTQSLDFNATALLLRSERTRVLAGNIANADTPNFKARDFDFRSALEQATSIATATGAGGTVSLARTQEGHIAAGNDTSGAHPALLYRTPTQTALDANSVDLDTERAAFVDNSVRYEASLRFINTQIRTLMTAINGGQGS